MVGRSNKKPIYLYVGNVSFLLQHRTIYEMCHKSRATQRYYLTENIKHNCTNTWAYRVHTDRHVNRIVEDNEALIKAFTIEIRNNNRCPFKKKKDFYQRKKKLG